MTTLKLPMHCLPDGPEECEAYYRQELLKNINLYTSLLTDNNFQSLNRMYSLKVKGWGTDFNLAVATKLAEMGISHRDAFRACY